MAIDLTPLQRTLLQAYHREDPNAEQWICPWALGDTKLSYDEAVRGARDLCRKKLLEGDSSRGPMRGYSITAKGREAVQAA